MSGHSMKDPTLQDVGPQCENQQKIPQPTIRQIFGVGRVSADAAIEILLA
jgi:hypothetical protein